MEKTTQETVEQGIFSEVHNKRYTLAGEAPICNGELFQDFGYLANTPASNAVLDGTYTMPLESDQSTADLFVEIARSVRSSQKTPCQSKSRQANGNVTGRW